MADTSAGATVTSPAAGFAERYVEADGFRIRYFEAGSGPPLICFHASGGPRLGRGHQLLAEHHRVILFETPGFGQSAVNDRTENVAELARTMALAVEALGIERYSVWGTSFGGRLASWLAIQHPERLDALVLVAPAAILPEDHTSRTAGVPLEDRARLYFAHPERQPAGPPPDPAVIAKQEAFLRRVRGPNHDPDLEAGLASLNVPTLVLFGTEDRLIPTEMGPVYREIMPNCHLIYVYDAGHHVDADRPEAFAEVVGDFLERHEQFVVQRASSLIHP
ncbi:MAG: alpha/beta hydrolase [Chloroflexota bacterium]